MIQRTKTAIRTILPKNAFARGVSLLVGGTVGAQVLTVLAAPLLTRLYSSEDFGLLSVYTSLLALIGVISSLRYELAIPLPEDDGEAANIAVLSLIFVGLNTLLTCIIVLLLRQPVIDLLGVPALNSYLWLLPVGVMLSGAYKVFNYWSVRTKRFSTIAGTNLHQVLASLSIQLAAFKLGGIALLFGQVASQSVGTTSLGRSALKNAGFRQVSWGGIVLGAKRYRQFPILSTWGGLIDVASTKLPLLVVSGIFGVSEAGFLSIAERILQMPASLLGRAISQVFLSGAADANRKGELKLLVQKVSSNLIHIGLPPAVLIFLTGPDLFSFIFGDNWRQAGEFARWMTPWIYLQFISSPLSVVYLATEKIAQSVMWQTTLFIVNISALFIGVFINEVLATVMILSAANTACYIILFIWIARLSNNSLSTILGPMLFAALTATVCVIPILFVKFSFPNSTGPMIFAFITSVVLIIGRYFSLFTNKP